MQMLLQCHDGIEIVAEAADGKEAVEKAVELAPDVVLMDLLMPEMNGLDAVREILARRPDTRIVILTGSERVDDMVMSAVRAGAVGYVEKGFSPDQLLDVICRAHRGELALTKDVTRKLLHPEKAKSSPWPDHEVLTDREREILCLVAQGFSNREIADQIYVSASTVTTHLRNIFGKLSLKNRVEATLYAIRTGLITVEV